MTVQIKETDITPMPAVRGVTADIWNQSLKLRPGKMLVVEVPEGQATRIRASFMARVSRARRTTPDAVRHITTRGISSSSFAILNFAPAPGQETASILPDGDREL